MAIKMTTEVRAKRDASMFKDKQSGMSFREVAAKYNLNVKTIYEIIRRIEGNSFIKKPFRKEGVGARNEQL